MGVINSEDIKKTTMFSVEHYVRNIMSKKYRSALQKYKHCRLESAIYPKIRHVVSVSNVTTKPFEP